MKVQYLRVSSLTQNTARQKVNGQCDWSIEDKCSGSIPFFERPGGKEIEDLLEKDSISELHVWTIDRLGRNLRDILNTIYVFKEKKVPIVFVSQGLRTMNLEGKEEPMTTVFISLLGAISEMRRSQILEAQAQGIALRKARNGYFGRKPGTKEDTLKFLSKPKNKKALELLKKDYKCVEVAKVVGLHTNTITKIKRLGFNDEESKIAA
jgi:DNA invertase Pin-like site-specific DNA recombinase